jgi:adenylate kinase
MDRVLVIAGSPGVGKTSLSTFLTRYLKGVSVNISELVSREGMSCGFDEERKTLIADVDKVSKRVEEIIQGSEGWVVVDGHFAIDLVPSKEVFLAFVLRRDPSELREVLKSRGFDDRKVDENVAAEILDVCLFDAVETYGEEKVCEIDITGRSEEDVADEVIQIVEGKKECKVGKVDWLTKLELAGRLEEFLKDL